MTPASDHKPPAGRSPRGLRARLWFACLIGALATALGSAFVIWAVSMAGTALDARVVMQAIGGACLLGLAIAVIAGHWVASGVSGGLKNIEEGIARGHLTDSRAPQWGELSQISAAVRSMLERDRDLREDEAELQALRVSIVQAREAVERWIRSEHWAALSPGSGGLAPLTESLDRGFAREMEVRDHNLESAKLVHAELLGAVDDARGSAELAEHGYVEVTALLTTVREIARLTGEIQQSIRTPAAEPAPEIESAEAEWRSRAAQAIEALVAVSGESVQQLGEGLMRVREINEQVQLMSNRATLIALNAVMSSGRPDARIAAGEGPNVELKQLAREVRTATERVAALSAEIDRAVESANLRMREVREHVVARLVELPAPPPAPAAVASTPTATMPLLAHWVERLREMVQDATRKGERLAESEEKVSSSVQKVSRRLEDEARDLEGLVARLSPTGATSAREGAPATPRTPATTEARGARPLRLLGTEPEKPGTGREGQS